MSIMDLLTAGYSEEKIIEFLSKHLPALGQKILKAKQTGYDPKEIFKSLKNFRIDQLHDLSKTKEFNSSNPWIDADKMQKQANASVEGKKYLKHAAAIATPFALRALTDVGMPLVQKVLGELGQPPTSPTIAGQPMPQPTPSPMQQTPGQQINQQQMTPTPAPQVAQAAQAIPQAQPQQEITQEQINANPELQPDYDYLKKKNLIPKIQTMVKGGKTKEQIVNYLKKNIPMMEQEYLRSFGMKEGQTPQSIDQKLESMVDKYFLGGQPKQEPIAPDVGIEAEETKPTKRPYSEKEFIDAIDKGTLSPEDVPEAMQILFHPNKNTPPLSVEERIEKLRKIGATEEEIEGAFATELKKSKITKGTEVLTPKGMGTVKAEDAKGLIVESDGKAHKISKDEAITSPLPEKDLADLYTDLVNKIPESERSSMINVAGYDPNVNEFIFMPHDGALYVYKDIPPEFAEKLQKALFQAKTTGSNFYGAWSQGEESRGAGLSALIKELQKLYGGKGKEYIRKYEKVYDFFALPKQAIKEREKREREERKKRKQRPS